MTVIKSGTHLCCALAACLIAACGDEDPAAKIETYSEHAPAAGGGAAPKPSSGMKLSITIPGVEPGQEGTKCVQLRLPNAAPVDVIQLHNTLSRASHHFIITALADPEASEQELEDCRPFRGALAGAPLAITQKHDDLVTLPQGVGYRLNAEHVMHLEMHYLNASDETVDVVAEAELITAPPGAALEDGSVLLVGTTDIHVPPHATHMNTPKYLALPKGMEDVKFFAITGHTHRFGTNVTVSSASGPGAALDRLYAPERYDWEAPEMKELEPHVSIPSGGGFMLQCSWNNTSDAPIGFGESATQEMCFFWGYYYPRKTVASVVLDNLDPSVLRRL